MQARTVAITILASTMTALAVSGCEPQRRTEPSPQPPETQIDTAEGTYTGEVEGRTITLVLDRVGRAELRQGEPDDLQPAHDEGTWEQNDGIVRIDFRATEPDRRENYVVLRLEDNRLVADVYETERWPLGFELHRVDERYTLPTEQAEQDTI